MTYAHGMPYRLMLGDPAAQPTVLAALAGFDAPAHVPRVEAVEELRAIAWQSLYGDNLAPLFAALASVTRIAPSLMWTNAAESVATLHESAEEYLDLDLAAPVIAECDTVFAAESLPGIDDRTNPLRGRLERPLVTVDGQEYRVETRKMCCLCYLLEDRSGRLCQNCPYLSAEDRVRLVRERHGLPIGSPGGPAEKQAIARGRQRPSIGVVLRSR
jgi:hypothetical protein